MDEKAPKADVVKQQIDELVFLRNTLKKLRQLSPAAQRRALDYWREQLGLPGDVVN